MPPSAMFLDVVVKLWLRAVISTRISMGARKWRVPFSAGCATFTCSGGAVAGTVGSGGIFSGLAAADFLTIRDLRFEAVGESDVKEGEEDGEDGLLKKVPHPKDPSLQPATLRAKGRNPAMSRDDRTHRFTVPRELEGQRLDVVIARLAAGVSRRHARRLVDDGAVFVDNKRVQVCSRPLKAGAKVELTVTSADRSTPAEPTRILAIDADLVVADKAAGVPTEPTREGARGTLKAHLEDELKARGESLEFLHAVHRLDTDTTGAVVFARSAEAAHKVGRQLHDGTAERRYLALVAGIPEWTRARLDWSLTKVRDESGRSEERRVGKEGRQRWPA